MTARPILISVIRLRDDDRQKLNPHYALVEVPDAQAILQLPQEQLAQVQAIFSPATRALSNDVLATLPQLKVISNFGVGYDGYDEDYIRARRIALGYTPDVLNDCVADLAFALMLDCARQVSASDRYIRAGRWATEGPFPLATQLSYKRLGIVGLGRIGLCIATRAKAFGMEIFYHNRRPREGVDYHYVDNVVELARRVDFLMVVVPGGDETKHLINQEVLNALGPTGYLINVARGSAIDEQALVDALREQRIAGAGLDVFAHEPHVPAALFDLDNVVLTPHIGSATQETRQAMRDLAIDNLVHFAQHGEVKVSVPWARYEG